LARKENKEPASPQYLAQNLQLFALLRSGRIAESSKSSNTGNSLPVLGIRCRQHGIQRENTAKQ
jgi:hypothetical protein